MRLNQHQIETLKRLGTENFGTQAKLILFGSRADDSRRGGDIDLYVTGIDQHRISYSMRNWIFW